MMTAMLNLIYHTHAHVRVHMKMDRETDRQRRNPGKKTPTC